MNIMLLAGATLALVPSSPPLSTSCARQCAARHSTVLACERPQPKWLEMLLYGREGPPSRRRPKPPPAEPTEEPVSRYVPPEEWAENNKLDKELQWYQRVQWEAQRNGNQVRQNEILQREIGRD